MAQPLVKAVGDSGVLLVFGESVDPVIFDRILALDAALNADPPPGMRETVPAYVSLLVVFDPLLTDAAAIAAAVLSQVGEEGVTSVPGRAHLIPLCSDIDLAPDLEGAAEALGMTAEAVIAAHLGAEYRVYMYGFAPGYAYMDGVPEALHLPRKAIPVRSRPIGSVMIAGGQCLITTLEMPTGWWVIGQTKVPVLRLDSSDSFLFRPGDRVRFKAVSRAEYEAG